MEQTSESLGSLIRKGNKSSGSAAIGNTCIAVVKAAAFALTGSGSMFATMMHSIADAVNQMFVFTGSVLAEKRPTRLVFYEDLVATSGGALAMLAVLVTAFTSFKLLDGVSSILIAFMMIGVAFRVGYDNMVGLIGVAAPPEIEDRVALIIFDDPQVTDIYQMRILQEGRYYHVEGLIELKKGMTLADADDIKFKVRDKLLADPHISDVTLGILEDNGIRNWEPKTDG